MPDREKVMAKCRKCIDTGEAAQDYQFYYDVIAPLKEQEAKEVKESTNMYTGLPITHCPKCGISLDRYLYGRQCEGQINYCPMCGQKVKWE